MYQVGGVFEEDLLERAGGRNLKAVRVDMMCTLSRDQALSSGEDIQKGNRLLGLRRRFVARVHFDGRTGPQMECYNYWKYSRWQRNSCFQMLDMDIGA
jgi:hypothetical protein